MNILPLPLLDGCLFVDATSFEKYTTCRRSWQYYALHKREAAGKRAALEAGALFHSIMEVRRRLDYRLPLDKVEYLQEQMTALLFLGWERYSPVCDLTLGDYLTERHPDCEDFDVLYPGYTPALDDFRTESHMINVLRAYNKEYPVEPFTPLLGQDGKPMVEQSFAYPLVMIDTTSLGIMDKNEEPIKHVTIYWTGRLDYPTVYEDGVWNMDLKTGTRDDGFMEYANNQAQNGYLWALGKYLGHIPTGFVIDKVFWRPPTAKGKGIEFKRHRERVEPERITEWENNTIHIFEDMLHDYARNYFPMETSWCVGKYGPCGYLDVCKLKPSSRAMLLESTFYKDVTWSPLRNSSPVQQTETNKTNEQTV